MGKYKIKQEHVEKMRKYLGEEGLRFFRHLKGLKGDVFPVLKLNFKKKGLPVHPVLYREGRTIRNWIRTQFHEFSRLYENDMYDLSKKLIEKAIKL